IVDALFEALDLRRKLLCPLSKISFERVQFVKLLFEVIDIASCTAENVFLADKLLVEPLLSLFPKELDGACEHDDEFVASVDGFGDAACEVRGLTTLHISDGESFRLIGLGPRRVGQSADDGARRGVQIGNRFIAESLFPEHFGVMVPIERRLPTPRKPRLPRHIGLYDMNSPLRCIGKCTREIVVVRLRQSQTAVDLSPTLR